MTGFRWNEHVQWSAHVRWNESLTPSTFPVRAFGRSLGRESASRLVTKETRLVTSTSEGIGRSRGSAE